MKLKLGKPTKMWACVANDDALTCADTPPLYEDNADAVRLLLGGERVERVLVTVTRVPKKARGK